MANLSPTLSHEPVATTNRPERVGDLAERLGTKADDLIVNAQRAATHTARSVQAGLDDLRDTVPAAVTRAAANAEDLTRRGVEYARRAAVDARHRAGDLGEAAVHRIREQPLKGVLIAAAAGALAMLLLQWMSRRRG